MRNNYTHKTTIFFLSLLLALTLFFSSSAFATITDTGYNLPISEGSCDSDFDLPERAYICGEGQWAYADNWAGHDNNDYYDFHLNESLPSDATITGIIVKARLASNNGNGCVFNVRLSWDACSSYTNYKSTPTITSGVFADFLFGNSSDLWGHSWTVDELNDTNFRVFCMATSWSSDIVKVDCLQVIIYYALPPADTEIDINYPLNSSICNNATTDFSVQIWDNDTIDPQNAIIHLFQCDGLNTWEYIGAYNDSINSGDYFNGTFATCYNRTYAWYLNVTNADGTTFFPDAGWDWYNDSFNYSLSCIDDSHVYHFMTGCDNMSMIIYGYNDSSMLFDDTIETNSLNVQLHLNAPHADYMAFADDSDPLIYSDDWDYAPLFNYTLPCLGNGVYTVWVRYTDDCGYYYCYDTINVTGITPDLTLTYPVEDETYTSVEWGEDHDLILEGVVDSSFNIAINVTCEWYTMLDDIYTFDTDTMLVSLEPYVCFDDTNYSIIINVSNCFGYQLLYVNFTIGDPSSDLARHISLKSISPERENYSQLTLLEQGIYYDIISTEISGIPYTFLLTDWDGYLLYEINDVAYLDEQYGWQSKNWYKERFYSRSFYKSWIGIINVTDDVQFDDLYGYAKINYVSFNDVDEYHYIFNNSDINASGRYQILSGEYISDNALIYSSYTGIMWGFGTFHINDIIPLHSLGNTLYDNPNIYVNDWGGFLDEYYPGLSLFAGMMIILLFSLMPILITQSFPPMAIQMFFTSMGIVLSTCMGIFPLWVLQILSIAIIMAIFYKILDWYRTRSGVQSFKDTPLGKDVGVKSAYGKMERRGEGLKSIYGKYKEGRRSLGKDASTSQPIYPGRRGE